jgi:hypothetical protein
MCEKAPYHEISKIAKSKIKPYPNYSSSSHGFYDTRTIMTGSNSLE